MSSDGSTTGTLNSALDEANAANASHVVNGSGNSNGSGGGAGSKCHMMLTPRFTQEEKEILYSLFHHHEEIIDIKFRKKNRSKYSVRDAWEQIVNEFNSHPNVSAVRNLKQIQKFWLNSRLRKQYPFRSINQKQNAANSNNDQQAAVHQQRRQQQHQQQQHQQQQQQQQQLVPHPIKTEPDYQISANEAVDNNEQSDTYEEMEMDGHGVAEMEDDSIDNHHHQQQQQEQVVQQQQQQQQQQLQQQVAQAAIQTQQINVDQISAEKLTLNDLLQFKTTRPREEIILQIKHPGEPAGAQITLPSPTRITIPSHHQPQQHTMATITANGYNQQIISEIKPQQITLAQYQAQQQLQQQQLVAAQQQQQQQQQQHLAQQAQLAVIQQHQQQQQQQQQAAAAAAAAAAVAQQHQQVKMQIQATPAGVGTTQFAPATPTFTCATFSALPTVGAPTANSVPVAPAATMAALANTPIATSTPTSNTSNIVGQETYDDKINFFKLKEAELRYKEQQVSLEKKKIELSHVQDQLKHLKEVHRLQVEELKVKIRILQEEEKQLMKAQSSSLCS